MGRTATRAQEAKSRAREARLTLLVERSAQDQRIEDAVAAALLAADDRAAGLAQVEQAERDAATALLRLSREKVPMRDMASLTGMTEPVCARLLKLSVGGPKQDATGGRSDDATDATDATDSADSASGGQGGRVDAAG
jgi:hypothetical protein